MDKMSWLSIALVSVPEELVYTVITCLIVGKRDFFKGKENILRVILATILTVITAVSIRAYSPYFLINVTLLQIVCFVIIYTLVLQIQWHKAAIGFLIAYVTYGITELLCVGILIQATGITAEQILANDLYRIAFSILPRVLQILAAVALGKASFTLIDYGIIGRFTRRIAGSIAFMIVSIGLAVIVTAITVKHFIFDFNLTNAAFTELSYLVFNIVVLLAVVIAITAKLSWDMKREVIKMSQDIKQEKEETLFTLFWCKTLCNTYPGDTLKIKEIIDKVIERNGGKVE